MNGIARVRASSTAYLDTTAAAPDVNIPCTLNMCAGTNAITEFTNYAFNSYACINGRYVGASRAGLVELDVGGVDTRTVGLDTTDHAVDAFAEVGSLHFGSMQFKRLTDVYMGMRADGPLSFGVTVDENSEFQTYSYDIDPVFNSNLRQRRVAVGKGLTGKYWKFSISNPNGVDFEIDSVDISATLVARRR